MVKCALPITLALFFNVIDLAEFRPSSSTSFGNSPPTIQDESSLNVSTSTASSSTPSSKTRTRILTHANINRGGFVGEFIDQDIIFPDAYQIVFEPIMRIDGAPGCAAGQTFCESVDTYPFQHVEDVLRRKTVSNDLFGKDEPADIVINRIGEVEENFVCESVERTIFPKLAKNKNNKWKYIVNQGTDGGYVQGVRVETCRRKDAPCAIIGELPTGYITSCKQKYIYRRMMSLTDEGDLTPDIFQLPSSCCCSYRRSGDFLSRLGRETNPVT